MKKRKSSIKELKPNKIGFKSSVSIYKEKFSDKEITFNPKFSITKNSGKKDCKPVGKFPLVTSL